MSTRVLLCDDSGAMLALLERRIKEVCTLGFEVVGKAKDGNECIIKYNTLKPDLVLLDITMPNKDGRECLQELLIQNPTAKVVMVSAVMDDQVRNACLAAGAKAFISKGDLISAQDFMSKILPVIQPIVMAA